MNRKIVILNGPPGCGKDTIAAQMQQHGFVKQQFKDELFRLALFVSRIPEHKWFARYATEKEQPWDLLGGLSQRQFLIRISEEWIKPVFGESYFGTQARNNLQATNTVFSDGGFIPEVQPLLSVAGSQVILFRLHRDGYSFAGDSRRYVYNSGAIEHDIQLRDGKVREAVAEILNLSFLND